MKNKIAILVSNQREFDLLMKHYSQNEQWMPKYPFGYNSNYPNFTHHNLFMGVNNDYITREEYEVISFSTFAQIAGIEVKEEIEVELTGKKAKVYKGAAVIFWGNNESLPFTGRELEAIYEAYQQFK